MHWKARHLKNYDRLVDMTMPKSIGHIQADIRGFHKYTGNTRPRLKRKLCVMEARRMCYESQKL